MYEQCRKKQFMSSTDVRRKTLHRLPIIKNQASPDPDERKETRIQ